MNLLCLDFDGTLIKVNSFPKWVLFILQKLFFSFKYTLFFKIGILLLKRKLGLTSHILFKQRLESVKYPNEWIDEFLDILLRKSINHHVMKEVNNLQSTVDKFIITTAAPCCYASRLSIAMARYSSSEFDVLCSHIKESCLVDNYEFNKVHLVNKAYGSKNRIVLFTDSKDDLPLAEISEFVYLCNPDQPSLDIFKSKSIPFTLIGEK